MSHFKNSICSGTGEVFQPITVVITTENKLIGFLILKTLNSTLHY